MKHQENTLSTNIIHILLSLFFHGWAVKAALAKSARGLLIVAFILAVYTALVLYRAIAVTKDFREVAKEDIEKAWNDHKMEELEISLRCCGKNGPNDYDKDNIPNSCYTNGFAKHEEHLHKDGCLEKYYERRLKYFGGQDMYVRWSEFALNVVCTSSTALMVYFYIDENAFN